MSTLRTLTRLATPDLLSLQDLSPPEAEGLLELTGLVKERPEEFHTALAGKHLALIFEKPSLRTRVTFEVGIEQLGGRALFLDQTRARLGARESLADIARNLERWVDGVVLRTFEHRTVTEMAAHASIPVVNGLSDLEHPCQALGDYFTLAERFGDLRRVKLAFVGDGNNVCHSLLLAAALLGSRIAVATPPGYEPAAEIVRAASDIAARTGGRVELTYDWQEAVRGADAVYTDVWASMGQEEEATARKKTLAPYQVNAELMAQAAAHGVFLHCLPAHRGQEVTDAVMDSPASLVYEQAENRLHVQKAILLLLMGNGHRPRSFGAGRERNARG